MRDQRCDTAVLLGKRAQILRSAALPPTARGVPPPARHRAARRPEGRLPWRLAAFWRALGAAGARRGHIFFTLNLSYTALSTSMCVSSTGCATLTALLKTGRAHSSTLRSSQVPHEPAHTWCMKLGLDSHSPASACARYGAGGR